MMRKCRGKCLGKCVLRLPPLLLAALLAGGSSLTSARAQAQAGPPPAVNQPPASGRGLIGLTFSLDVYGLRRLDDGYDLWKGGKDWSAVGLEVGYDAVRLGEGTRLALALGWMRERQESGTPGADPIAYRRGSGAPFAGQPESTSLHVAAQIRWRTDRTLQPYLGLAAGGTRSDLTLDPYTAGVMRSRAHGLLGRASVGLRVQPVRLRFRRSDGASLFALGLGIEVGALAGTPLEHEATAEAPSHGPVDPQPIVVQKVPLGALAPNGGYARLAIVVGF
jgi:hypothetical protein